LLARKKMLFKIDYANDVVPELEKATGATQAILVK
jgi:hypothetical protein